MKLTVFADQASSCHPHSQILTGSNPPPFPRPGERIDLFQDRLRPSPARGGRSSKFRLFLTFGFRQGSTSWVIPCSGGVGVQLTGCLSGKDTASWVTPPPLQAGEGWGGGICTPCLRMKECLQYLSRIMHPPSRPSPARRGRSSRFQLFRGFSFSVVNPVQIFSVCLSGKAPHRG